MTDSQSWITLQTIAQAVLFLVSLAGNILTVVVMATVVRRHRPDAYGPLLGWAVAGLALGVVTPMITFVSMRAGTGDIGALMRTQAILAFVGALVHVALLVVFLRGVVRLAQPPRPIEVERNPPYR